MRRHGTLDFSSLGFSQFESEFESRFPPLGQKSDFIVAAADHITNEIAASMYRDAQDLIVSRVPSMIPNEIVEREILKLYIAGMPAKSPQSLSNILNAGWEFVIQNKATQKTADRPLFEWISELIFKTIEVFEFERRLSA